MNKTHLRWYLLVALCIIAILIIPGESLPVHAQSSSPAEMLGQAWRKALDAGSYRYISDSIQTLIPRAVPEMIGQHDTSFDLAIDGAVVLPDQAYTEIKVLGNQRSDSVVTLIDGVQTFMLANGELKPVQNSLSLTSQSNNLLDYLAAADQVAVLGSPEGRPDLTRYAFVINGPRYADYVRQNAEAILQAEPGAPQGLTIQPFKALQTLSGQGELWVNQAGYPVRQVLDFELPDINDQYSAHVRMSADFSAFGKVESLPRAVQGADGKWQLQGTLKADPSTSLGTFPGFGKLPAQAVANQAANPTALSSLWSRLTSLLPLKVSPSAVIFFVTIMLVVILVRYYRRSPRRCYALIVFTLIPIMVFSPLLQSAGVVKFLERQAQAAEDSAKALPDLLKGLGFSGQEIKAATASQGTADKAAAGTNNKYSTTLSAGSQPVSSTSTQAKPVNIALQQTTANTLPACGDGAAGVDTDSDGLTDQVELCLGTNPNRADTDMDGIPDKIEVDGFEYPAGSGKYWTSDPLKADSNDDGLVDTMEWPATIVKNGQTITTGGQAANPDLDNDGIPNLWDDDDDGDGVPDAQDLSPTAVTGYATSANLNTQVSTQSADINDYEYIEIQVQPEDEDHLRYSMTTLDWPSDHKGNMKDLDDSVDDLRLVPFLIVNTNVAPDQALADKYGFRVWQNEGKYILMASLLPNQDNGAIHSFYAKLAYAPGQLANIQWQVQLVWMADFKNDSYHNYAVVSEEQTVHEYQDSFRITGLKITKDRGYEAAVFGTPIQPDDIDLFRLLVGMNDSFKSYGQLDDQRTGDTALQTIGQRFADNSTADLAHRFGIPIGEVKVSGPTLYGHTDAALVGVGSELVPGLLQNSVYKPYYENYRCQDSNGNLVNCASLVIAYESSKGIRDLSGLPKLSSGTTDINQLNVNLADVSLITTRGVQLRVYEEGTDGWQVAATSRILELMEQRYKNGIDTALSSLYPGLTEDGLRLTIFAAYLWATSPSYKVVAVDGQFVVDPVANETDLYNNRAFLPDEAAVTINAITYVGIGTGIFKALTTGTMFLVGETRGFERFLKAYDAETFSRWNFSWALINMAAMLATMLTGILNAICANIKHPEDQIVCQNKLALKVADTVFRSIFIVVQCEAIYEMIPKIADVLVEVEFVASDLAICAQAVGCIVSMAMSYGIMVYSLVKNGGNNPITWRMALANFIMTEIWLIALFAIFCIPIVGQLFALILGILDGLFYLFTWWLGDTGKTLASELLKIFYDAELCTNLKDGSLSFSEMNTSLVDPNMGLVGGNTLNVSTTFSGAIQSTDYGTSGDLDKSSIKGRLSADYPYYTPQEQAAIFPSEETQNPKPCQTVDDVKYCSNDVGIGYLLSPRINGIAPIKAFADYTIIWASYGMFGAWRWSTNEWSGSVPEEVDIIQPDFMYLDVLPQDITNLWTWSELKNNDPDGDGLTTDQEAALGTYATDWDSDKDGISDYYEWQMGTNPKKADTDGDGLSDGLEIRLGTNPLRADTDGDGLTDGQEVRRYENGAMVGGWQISINKVSYWVSSDPLLADTDGDGLNDAEEKANGLSPNAPNQLVPSLSLSVSPMDAGENGRVGAYWQPGDTVAIDIHLSNGSPSDINTTMTLDLPAFLGNIQVGTVQGDRTPSLTVNPHQLSWSFSGTDALQTYEEIDIPITATPTGASGTGDIVLSLPFGGLQMRKTVTAVMDSDPPEVAIVAPTNGAYLRGTSFVVGGAATDPTTWITRTELSVVKQGNSSSFQTLDGTSSPWAYSWNFAGDGVYTLQARATDVMGHVSTTTPVNVTVDNTPPTLTMTSSMVGSAIHLSGTATDNPAGVAWVELSLDGQTWRSVPLVGSSWSYDWTVNESAQGEHEARVIAIDRSGNQSDVLTKTVNVDSVAPTSIVNAGADPDVPPAVKPDTSFKISGVADDGGNLPLPSAPANLGTGMEVFDDSTLWLGISSIHDNDGGLLAAWIGDFNADRMADLAVGLPGPDGNAGQVAVLYGRAGGWPTPPDLEMLTSSPTRFSGVPGAQLGSYLAAAGDTNGDNFSDLLIGEHNSPRAFLIFGNPGTSGNVTLDGGHSGYRTMLQAPANIEGLAAAGDVNGDGYGDLLIQAGGTTYLLLGRTDPWPETIDLAAASAASFSGVTGALGVGDVDSDQLAEWITMKSGSVTLYGWNTGSGGAGVVSTKSTVDTNPRAVALGDVDADGKADWLYSNGTARILVYGSGGTHTFTGYDGFFAAPGDIDGDHRADIILANAAGVTSLVHQTQNGLAVLATVQGAGGAANAPYTTGADLNSDGSDDLLLIPTRAEAEARGFDAPDFSSGFISPQSLPLGVTSIARDYVEKDTSSKPLATQTLDAFGLLYAATSDTRYVDDDAVNGTCDGHSQCYTTIQAAVDASDGGGDSISIYPGAYAYFSVPAGANYDRLTIKGVSADAVFVDGGGKEYAISVAADGVHLSNLTVRNATNGISLDYSGGEIPVGSGNETTIDHVVAQTVKTPIAMNNGSALSLSDSTLVGNGTDPILSVTPSSNVYAWNSDQSVPAPIGSSGTLTSAGGNLYALPGGGNSAVYQATPSATGAVTSWTQSFNLQHPLPTSTGTTPTQQGTNLLVGGATTISQLHSNFIWPDLGGLANDSVNAIAFAPNGDLYVGGRFTKIGAGEFLHLARWDGTSWHKVGSAEPDGAVLALAFNSSGGVLTVGGEFTHIGATVANYLARYTVSTGTWSVLGSGVYNGLNGPVYALANDTATSILYIGGSFTTSTEYNNTSHPAPNLTTYGAHAGCVFASGSSCFDHLGLSTNSAVNTLALGNGRLYAGGAFTTVGATNIPANHVASYNLAAGSWSALGAGLVGTVYDIGILNQNRLAVAASDPYSKYIYEWDGSSTWSKAGGYTYGAYAVAVDSGWNVYTADNLGRIMVQPGGTGSFTQMADYAYFYSTPGGWDYRSYALEVDGSGQLFAGSWGWDYYNAKNNGAITRYAPASFYRRPASGGSWSRLPDPPLPSATTPIAAAVTDSGDNLYATWGVPNLLYYYNGSTWSQKASPPSDRSVYQLGWAGNYLYALAQSTSPYPWSLLRYDPASNSWTTLAKPLVPDGSPAVGRTLVWDGADHIYLLCGDATAPFTRYSISANSWEAMPAATVAFAINYGPAMARVGSYLYVFGTASLNNFFRYGSISATDLRLAIDRTVFVVPDTASSVKWSSLSGATGSQFFRTDIDSSNAWVAPSAANASPALPTGATRLTSAQAAFVAPVDGLYRLGATSVLTAGYHRYKAVAHVYPAQAACALCTSSSLTWGVDAFATIREAVESGAARVLIHPGIYPQTFYLVSGVDVIGSGAETTIIEPPAGTATTLVTAEGVAHASLARVTLAGGSSWDGFLAEGGAKGLKLTRTILRDLKTGVGLRGNSQVEIANNTIVSNTDGIVIESPTPVNVRNTILAYNSATGLKHGTTPTISDTYNDFWSNGTNIYPTTDVSLGSLFVDPRFQNLPNDDLRLASNSPLIDMGAPGDSTAPGGGQRVDIGYAEYNAAGFYVSLDYSETGLDDGLAWGVNAFAQIQPALDAAAAAMRDLQGALPAGGYSVAVDTGTYSGNITVPSHVRLVGSGAAVTTINAAATGSAVTFDGVIDGELSGFTVQNASSGAAGVELKGSASGITIARNVIRTNASYGIKLSEQSSAEVRFNTIVNNSGAGLFASGTSTWVDVGNNILDSNAIGLQASSGALVRNGYNLLHNTSDLSGVSAGEGTLTSAPAFATSSYYVPSAASPAIDAADPLAAVPPAGGLRADLGYKELIASPVTLFFGPRIKSTVSLGNSGVAKVEVGIVPVSDATQPVTATLPTTWETLTPSQSGQPLFYWSLNVSQATPGLYRVYSRATDAAGNTETDENALYEGAFVVDSTAPTVSLTLNPSGTTTASATLATATVSGTVSTGTGSRPDIAQVYFTVTGPAGPASYPAQGGQAWIPLPMTGTYTVTAVAVDEAGNQAQQSASVTVVASSSVATVTNPPNNTAVASTRVTLLGDVRFTGAGNGQVAVSVPGAGTVQAILASPGAAFSTWSAQVTLPTGDGSKTITVTPSLYGTPGTAATLNLLLDTTPPVLVVTSPAANSYVKQTAAFTGTASDTGSGLKRVEVSADGGYTWRQAAVNSGNWSLTWDLGLNHDYISFPVQVRAVDAVGNTALIKRPVAVDNIPPTGLEPVTFNHPVGDHLEDGTQLAINWNSPVDASGSIQVLMDVNKVLPVVNTVETVPTTLRTGINAAVILDTIGEWYVHIMAQDAAGNQTLLHYGPWYVEDTSPAQINNRHKSVVIDGFIDTGLHEWKENDLLDEDARSGHPQKLYATWDAQYVYLGWTNAWWTLDGVLWAYLDTVDGSGASIRQDGASLPSNLLADRAVEIRGPGDGSLWTWSNNAWVEQPLGSADFANGPSGDTEVRVQWTPTPSQGLKLVAYAMPQQIAGMQAAQSIAPAGEGTPAAIGPMVTLQGKPSSIPWAEFPTTNPLMQPATISFDWSTTDLVSSNPNLNQPKAQTVYMTVSTPQARGMAWSSGSQLDYSITLANPEPVPLLNLSISLTATTGLTYLAQNGAICTSCTNNSAWTLTVPTLAAGETKTITVQSRVGSVSSSVQQVTSTFVLSAGTLVFTPESKLTATITHRVDGQAPTVTIDALDGSVMPAGNATFTGTASDNAVDGGPGSGIASVEVSLNGAAWTQAKGAKNWSITLGVSGSSATLQARARDRAGNVSTISTHTFYVDGTPPTVTWTLPALTIDKKATISGTVQDQGPSGSRVHSVEVQVDEAGAWRKANLLTSPNGTQSWIWTWVTRNDDGVSHKLRVRATDEVGNATITPSQSTLVDTTGPKIAITQQVSTIVLPNDPEAVGPSSITAPAGNVSGTALLAATGSTVTLLGGTVAEYSGLAYFYVKVYGPGGFSRVDILPTNGNWAYASDITGWKVGNHRLRVQAKDNNGNTTLLGPFPLVVKDASITNLAASNDSPHKVNEVVTFTATVSSGSNVIYTWDFGDGSTGSGRIATHTYTTFGTLTARVTAKNSTNTMTATTMVNITGPVQSGPVFTVNSTAGTNDHVCDMSNCTLREAIEAANNDGLDSTIELSKLDYGLSEADNSDDQSGNYAVNLLPQITTNITINGHGARIYRVSAINYARFFSIPGTTTHLTLNEVWLQGGKAERPMSQDGGAIRNYGILTVKNSLLDSNEAMAGGAIYNGGTLNLYNSTVYSNISEYGAISGNGSFYLYSNTLLNNQGTTTSAIHLNSLSWSAYGFYNNIIAASSAGVSLCNLMASNIPVAGNLATDSSCTGFGVTTYTALSLTRGLPYDEGGPTPSVAISSTSSAVDKGNTTACLLAALESRDQRGYIRFIDGNKDGIATCDVGSFEFGSSVKPPAPAPDGAPPQVRIVLTPASPDGTNDWYRSPVTVEPQARDAGSDVVDLRCSLDPEVEPLSFDELPEQLCSFMGGAPVSADGVHTFYTAAMDTYGNKSAVVKASFKLDATPPVITCPAAGPFLLKSGDQVIGPADVDASVSGLDEPASALSGVISTDTVGAKVLTFSAADLAGNSASQNCSYSVIYDFSGFFPPLDQAPALNQVKAGQAVSLKFSLAGDQGLEVIAEGYPTSQQVDPETLAAMGDAIPADTVGKRDLSYDETTGWYNYVWKTDKTWAGTSRVLILQLEDGTQHLVYFNFQ